ncbi:hypothetical protein AM596_15440 [Clostridium perfringens CP4]|uniref:hypothetical protein n=1 Tax=Clostridium perfringens TaxID=1502 RepID=UPI00070743E6|nr:hypothetical protein [Clostridium perfringens]KQC91321.1 hypothetical protein AM596_15440 [Clostridium perfringens CP4]
MNKNIDKIREAFKEYNENIDWSIVKEGTKVMVFHEYNRIWLKRYFSSKIKTDVFPTLFEVSLNLKDEYTGEPAKLDDRRYEICVIVED